MAVANWPVLAQVGVGLFLNLTTTIHSFTHLRAPPGAFLFGHFEMTIRPDAELSAWAGQATWADSATDRTCRECLFWSQPGERVSRSRPEYFGKHELAPKPCLKARKLNPEISAPVPHEANPRAAACVGEACAVGRLITARLRASGISRFGGAGPLCPAL